MHTIQGGRMDATKQLGRQRGHLENSQMGLRGVLTKLLAEAFIEEEEFYEPMPREASIKNEKELNRFLQRFTKPSP